MVCYFHYFFPRQLMPIGLACLSVSVHFSSPHVFVNLRSKPPNRQNGLKVLSSRLCCTCRQLFPDPHLSVICFSKFAIVPCVHHTITFVIAFYSNHGVIVTASFSYILTCIFYTFQLSSLFRGRDSASESSTLYCAQKWADRRDGSVSFLSQSFCHGPDLFTLLGRATLRKFFFCYNHVGSF